MSCWPRCGAPPAPHGAEAALTGILPTLRKSDLTLTTDAQPRYAALNNAMSRVRGGDYEFRLKGLDELILKHDSVMLEACCTSFQVHYQVGTGEFDSMYNLAQAITGPLLPAATNSPLLFGRRLWRETRDSPVSSRRSIPAVPAIMCGKGPRA